MFEKANHVYCQWHIMHDLTKHAAGAFKTQSLSLEEFTKRFSRLLQTTSEEEFNIIYSKLFDGCDFDDDHPLRTYIGRYLIPKKNKWGGPWVKNTLNLGLVTTQRVEISNRSLKLLMDHNSTLLQTIEGVQNLVRHQVSVLF